MRTASLILSAGCLFIPLAAQADVLEISGPDYGWIAGGPKTVETVPMSAMPQPQPPQTGRSAPVTLAGEAAGPPEWQAHIARLAAKYDISASLLEAVVWQESRWNPAALSPVGARGLAQLMPGTAQMMGVDADDPHANLEGGARYLREQLDAFGGNVEKALAAYNAGPARVKQAGGIPAIRETQDYVAAIMARLSAPVRK